MKNIRRRRSTDSVHRLRILTRRLRAVIWLSRHSLHGPKLKALESELRALSHRLGEKRTVDVLHRDAAHYELDTAFLSARRKCADRALRQQLKDPRRSNVTALLERAQKKLKTVQRKNLRIASAELMTRLEVMRQTRPRSRQEWHRVRIQAKKIRYSGEVLGVEMPELKKLQDVLGHAHDLQVLRKTLRFRAKQVSVDERRAWSRAEQILDVTLRKAERRLLAWRRMNS